MNQLVSLSRNMSLQIADSEKDEDVRVVAVVEIIIAHTDGKNYTMNDHGDAHRTTKVSESRLHLTKKSVRKLIEYLERAEEELKKWEEE